MNHAVRSWGQPNWDVVPFPEHKFIVGICQARTGHPLIGALLRPLAFWWAASNFTAEWFLNFAQIFGVPIRWASYDPAIPGLMEKVCAMLDGMGSTAWAAFPAGTTLEIKEPSHGGTDNPQVTLLDRADRQCDILVLGQTLTTDVAASGSRALGDVHASVRDEIVMAAAEWAARIVQQQIVRPICQLNWQEDDQAPEIEVAPHKQEDEKANAERDAILINAGIEFPKAYLYDFSLTPCVCLMAAE